MTPLLAALVGAALLAACAGPSGGGSSGGPASSPAATRSPTPVPSPIVTSGEPPAAAVRAVRRFWSLVGEGRVDEAWRTLVAPGSPLATWKWSGADISDAHFVRVIPGSVGGAPAAGATVEFGALVWITPSGAGNAWGDAGEHELFENVVRMSDGTWRMWESGTGP